MGTVFAINGSFVPSEYANRADNILQRNAAGEITSTTSTDTLGSSSDRWDKIWADDIDTTIATIGGLSTGAITIDVDDTEALLVRKDGDAGDIFTVDTVGSQVKLLSTGVLGAATTPTLSFGDGDTGFYESADNTINVALNGLNRWSLAGATFGGAAGTRFEIKNVDATATLPVFVPKGNDEDTGIGYNANDQLSLIAGGKEMIRLVEDTVSYVQIAANDMWLTWTDVATTGTINAMKVNSDDEIEFGTAINIGTLDLSDDSGLVTLVDMGVTATPGSGTVEGYNFAVDATDILTVYAEADGSGGIQNESVGVGTTAPDGTFHVSGSGNIISRIQSEASTTSSYASLVFTNSTSATVDSTEIRSTRTNSPTSSDSNLTFFTRGNGAVVTAMTIATTGEVGIGTITPSTTLELDGTLSYTPSADQARADDSTITIDNTIVRVAGDAGAAVLDTDPAIEDGASDGQIVIIQGTHDTNTVTIADAVNTANPGGVSCVLGANDTISYMWDSGESLWVATSQCNDN